MKREQFVAAKDAEVEALREALLAMMQEQHIHPAVAVLAMGEAIALLLNNAPPHLQRVADGLRELLVLVISKRTAEALALATLWRDKARAEEPS